MKTDDVLRRNWLIPEKLSPYDVGTLLGQLGEAFFLKSGKSQAWVVEASATDEDQQLGYCNLCCSFVGASCIAVTPWLMCRD